KLSQKEAGLLRICFFFSLDASNVLEAYAKSNQNLAPGERRQGTVAAIGRCLSDTRWLVVEGRSGGRAAGRCDGRSAGAGCFGQRSSPRLDGGGGVQLLLHGDFL